MPVEVLARPSMFDILFYVAHSTVFVNLQLLLSQEYRFEDFRKIDMTPVSEVYCVRLQRNHSRHKNYQDGWAGGWTEYCLLFCFIWPLSVFKCIIYLSNWLFIYFPWQNSNKYFVIFNACVYDPGISIKKYEKTKTVTDTTLLF